MAGRTGAQETGHRVTPVPSAGLAIPEHMHLLEAGLQGEQVAAVLHVAGHGVVVDVHGQVRRNAGGFLGQLLGVVGQRAVAAAVIFLSRLARLLQVVEVSEQGAAERGVLLDKAGDLVGALEAFILAEAVAVEALKVMDGVLFRALDRRGRQHSVDLCLDVVQLQGGVDPDAMQVTGVVGGQVGNVDPDFLAHGFRSFVFRVLRLRCA